MCVEFLYPHYQKKKVKILNVNSFVTKLPINI